MRKVVLYIAQSMDGYIARSNGDISWLEEVPNPGQSDYGYHDFLQTADTVIMGRNTFEQVTGFGIPYPYANKKSYVFTRQAQLPPHEHATYIDSHHLEFVQQLKREAGKNIWLVGGSRVNKFFLEHGLIDEIRLFIMPVALGSGIPLFGGNLKPTPFKLFHNRTYQSGVTELHYQCLDF